MQNESDMAYGTAILRHSTPHRTGWKALMQAPIYLLSIGLVHGGFSGKKPLLPWSSPYILHLQYSGGEIDCFSFPSVSATSGGRISIPSTPDELCPPHARQLHHTPFSVGSLASRLTSSGLAPCSCLATRTTSLSARPGFLPAAYSPTRHLAHVRFRQNSIIHGAAS